MHYLLFALPFFASICFFQPPDGWECIEAKNPSEPVLVGFVGEAKKTIPPNLNLATEPTELSLKEYITGVKAVHESDLHVAWRDLGEFSFRGGKGRLGEICNSTPLGEIKILQGIFIQNKTAYILTGAALKEEFSEYRASLLAALRSLTVFPDLFSAIPDPSSRDALKKRFDQFAGLESPIMRQEEWEKLKKSLPNEFASLGSYWLHLALQEGRKRIFWTETPSLVE